MRDNCCEIMKCKITLLEFKLQKGLSKLVQNKNTWLAINRYFPHDEGFQVPWGFGKQEISVLSMDR